VDSPFRAGKVAYVGMAELLKEWGGRDGAGTAERKDGRTLMAAIEMPPTYRRIIPIRTRGRQEQAMW
jgi:hypothetical protein